MKNRLNDIDLEPWHKHTKAMNPSGMVVWTLKKEIQPEFITQVGVQAFGLIFLVRSKQKKLRVEAVEKDLRCKIS